MGSIMQVVVQPGVVAQATAALLEVHCLIQARHLPPSFACFPIHLYGPFQPQKDLHPYRTAQHHDVNQAGSR